MKSPLPAWLLLVLLPAGLLTAYDPPKGIPDPAIRFGWEIDRPTPAFPPEWTAGTPSAVANYYYVDKTHPSATDSGNLYGHPGLPRRTIPDCSGSGSLNGPLAAGSFIYIHAGTYINTDSPGSTLNWFGTGTQGNPIWITGNPTNRPVIQDTCRLGEGGNVSYFIIENLVIGNNAAFTAMEVRPTVDGDNIDHVLIRNIHRFGMQTSGDTNGVSIGLSSNSDTIPNSTISDVVVYNCLLENLGDKNSSEECGVYNAYHTSYVWVLNNTIHDMGADGVAGSHYSNHDGTRPTQYYFIGGNTIYGNGENGIDLKPVRYFVISENTITGPFTREQGWGIVLHYGAQSGIPDKDGWVIFNRISHVSGGIYTGLSDGCDDLNIVGNLVYDVRANYGATVDPMNGYCVLIGGSNGTFRVVNNTFHDYEGGIRLAGLNAGDLAKIHGNIFSTRVDPSRWDLQTDNTQEQYVSINHNVYNGTPQFRWANQTRTLAQMQSLGQEVGSVIGDPLFTNAAGGDFSISSGASPAVDMNTIEGPSGDSAYAAFQALFGVPILKDRNGVDRPVDGRWDAGALESQLPPNAAPSSLAIP